MKTEIFLQIARDCLQRRRWLVLVMICSGLLLGRSTHAATLPSGFVEVELANTFNDFVGITFDEANAMYAWDRLGHVWIIENDVKLPTPLLDISQEVGAWDDYGMLGVALHPNFRQNGYIYLLYVVDHHYLANFGTPNYNPNANEYFTATIGRITRYTARSSDNFHSVDPASRLVLVGETASTGFPIMFDTHGVGSLLFGTDGSLLASCGDGAELSDNGSDPGSYYVQALAEGIIRPQENVGAFRAQMVTSMSGKILRLDPATGNGLPSNPFYDPANPRAPRSRVYALGLRNPYRMTLRPGTGSHLQSDGFPGVIYLGDVGYFTWEELTVVTGPGQNCGWPIFEGYTQPSSYIDANPANQDAPNPLFGVGGCAQQYFTFRDLFREATTGAPSWPNPCNAAQQVPSSIPHFVHHRPVADWQHGTSPSRVGIFSGGSASTINIGAAGSPVSGPQFGGNCSIGGTWYTSNAVTTFPTQYQNTYFHGDLGNNWIKCFNFDSSNNLVSVQDFASGVGAVVGIFAHPTNGALYYVPWDNNIRKISYLGSGNRPPTAVASANINYGPSPLAVQFTGSNSFDLDGQALTYRWDFGDGSGVSTQANPNHTFTAPAGVPTRYDVTLTVSDTNIAVTSVNNYMNAEAGTDGTVLTTALLNSATKGVGGVWSISSPLTELRISTDLDPTFPATILCNGTNYTDAGSTRSLKIKNTVDRQFAVYTLNTSQPKLSVGCFVRLGNFDGSTFAYYDIFALEADSGEFSVLNFVDGDAGSLLFQEHTGAGTGTPMAVQPNTTYWMTMLWDRLSRLATLKIYNATTWALVGTSTKALDNGGTIDNCRAIYIGRYDAHRNDGANSANLIYYDDLMVDTTGNQYPLVPFSSSSSSTVSLIVSVNNTPPAINITSPINGSYYSIQTQTVVNLTANVTDLEHTQAQLSPQWQTVLHHNNHVHTSPIDTNWVTTSTLAPLGCDGDTYFYRINLTVTDAAGLSSTSFVDLFPNCSTNAPPTISDIPNQSILQGASTGPLGFTVADAETPAGSLTVSGTSSNPTLVPNANIVFGGSGGSRTVTVTPAAGQSGVATISVTVFDGTSAASDAFTLTVTPPNNTAPTISDIANQTTAEDTATGALGFTVSDAETAATSLVVTGSSSNPTLVPNANLVFSGNGAIRSLTVTPAANQSGTSTITVTVSDGLLSNSDTFLLTVTAVNDAPTISDIVNQTINQDTSTGPLAFTVGDVETAVGSLTVTGTSSNPTLVPNGNIAFGGSGANRTVTVTPVTGQFGTATITVTVSDGALTATDTFLLTVNSVTAPTYLFTEAFEGTGFENTGWIKHGTPNPDYTTVVLQGAQSLNCVGAQYCERPFVYANSFYLYFQARWNTWGNYNNIIYWDDSNYNIVIGLYADNAKAEIKHGSVGVFGTTALTANTTYHFWVEWTKGTGANGTLKLFVSTTGVKPANPEANITTGNGAAPARMYLGPTGSGPNAIFDRLLVDDVPIGSNPGLNQPPTISDIANQTVSQGGVAGPLAFTVGDAETAVGSLTVAGTSSNTTLVPNANIVFGGSGANRTVTVTPVAGQTGTSTITVTVSDGSLTASDTFLLTVTGVNTPPTISTIADLTVNEDTATGPIAFTVGDAETAAGSLTVSGTSSNPTLVPNANIAFGGSGANRTVTVTPAANQSGTATITVTVSDGALTASDPFVLTVNAVNDAPTISNIADLTVNEDTSTGPIAFTIGDVETAAASLTVTAGSSNPTLVPVANIVFGGSGANRTVTVTPAANQSGTATITVTVSDGALTASDPFVLTVTAVNDAPSISNIADLTVNEDTSTGPIAFTIGDVETAAASLTVTASSSNPTLVPNANIALGGSGANRTVTVTPAADQSGTATITVTVSDGLLTASDTFVLTVTPVNDAPTISNIADLTVNEDTATAPIAFTVGDVETAAASLTVTASSSNPTLVPNANIALGGSGANRTVTVTPAANQSGAATITVTVSDGSLTASDTFVLTVTPVNDPPTLSHISNQSIAQDGTTGPLGFTVADPETAPAALTVTGTSSNQGLVPDGNIAFGGSGANRTVTVTPLAGQNGTASITLTVSDGLLSASDSFVLTVIAGNTAPTITVIADQTVNEDTAAGPLAFTVGDAETPAGNLVVSGSSSDPVLVPNANITFGGSGASRTVTVLPATNLSGTATITVTVNDGVASVNTAFVLTVTAVNDPPTISNLADRTIAQDTSTGPISFTVDDVDTPAGSLTVSGNSSNPGLVPNGNIAFGGSGANRTVTVTPAAGQTGTATITVTVSDGNLTASDPFVLTVTAVNTAPTISDIADLTVNEDTSTGPLAFTVGDAETPAGSLTVTASSSNPTLVPNANIVLGGSGANRTVTVTPAPNQFGSATITVTVSDGAFSASDPFVLTVTSVNDAPTISNLADLTVNEDTSTGPLAFTIGDVETAAASLTVSALSSNPTLVPNANIVFGGSGANRTVTVNPAANQSGSATITVTVSDGALTASAPFVLTVLPVNDTPTISTIAAQTINQDTSTAPLAFTVGDVETAAGSLNVTGTSSNPTLVPNANIVLGGSGASRTVTVTPAAGQFGTATITLTVSDGTATATSAFLLTVNNGSAPTYLFTENFEGTGFENTGWIKHGASNPDYTNFVLQGAQSLNCVGAQYNERPFVYGNSFNLYFKARWNTWKNQKNIIYWDDPNYNIVIGLYADNSRAEIMHGSAGAFGTTTLASGTTYHFWLEWTQGTGANGTLKLFISTTGVKPASPEASITTGNGVAPARMYLGPTSTGPNVIFDRVLVDDVPILSNP
jgi:hypothetical protein